MDDERIDCVHPALCRYYDRLCSDFLRISPGCSRTFPRNIRTTSEQRPVQYPLDTGTIPKKQTIFPWPFKIPVDQYNTTWNNIKQDKTCWDRIDMPGIYSTKIHLTFI